MPIKKKTTNTKNLAKKEAIKTTKSASKKRGPGRPPKKKNSTLSEAATKKTVKKKERNIKRENFYIGLSITMFSLILLFVFIASFMTGLINVALRLDNMNKIQEQYQYQSLKLQELENGYINGLEFFESSEYVLDNQVILESSEFFVLSDNDERKIQSLNFLHSPDGENFAYVVSDEDEGSSIVLNGIKGPVYDSIKFMIFSPDSKHFAYGVREGDDEFVVLDGEEGKAYNWVISPYSFTPDSRFMVYKARDERGDFLVFNDDESGPYNQIYNPFISASEEEFIFFSRIEDKIIKHSLKLQEYAN